MLCDPVRRSLTRLVGLSSLTMMKHLIGSKSALELMGIAVALASPAKDYFVFVGTYTNALSRGIYVSRLDAATGILSAPELAVETPSPCYLAVSPELPPSHLSAGNRVPESAGNEGRAGKIKEQYIYAANSIPVFHGEKTGAVSSFAVDNKTGHLTLLNQKSADGNGPCHVSTDGSGRVLLIANYGSGSLKSYQVNRDGSLGAEGSRVQHKGSSVNPSRQTAPHAHSIYTDPSRHFAIACDLGTDQVMIYLLASASGTMSSHASAAVSPGSGPRHLTFSPDGKYVHVINEMGCSVTTFAWDATAGKLTPIETVSALPPGLVAQPNFTAAEILAFGSQVYATIRGHDSVSVFSTDASTGRLTFVQNLSGGGKVPRGMGLDPSGRWLFVGNQNSDNVVEFSRDSQTGKLSPVGRELKIGSPVDVKFAEAY